MRKIVFKSRYNEGTVSARRMLRQYDTRKGHHWAHSLVRGGWDYRLTVDENHQQAVRQAVRVQMQKDPVSISWGGEDKDGILWVVEVTE